MEEALKNQPAPSPGLPPEMPLFSVIVATWNRAGLLPRALGSLRAQTCPDWEAVVVDDGSTDDTDRVMAPWLDDPRIRYLPRPHAGLSAARNAGIDVARGRWITFLDSDDEYAPEYLASRAEIIAAHSGAGAEIDLIEGGFQVIGPPETHFVPDVHDPARLVPLSECVVGGTLVFRAPFLRGLGGFPRVAYGMDFALRQSVAAAGGRVVACTTPTYLYHREPGVGMCEEQKPG